MVYFWAVIAVLLVWGVARAIRWYHLPEVVEWRAKRAMKWQEERTKRVIARRRKWRSDEALYAMKNLTTDTSKDALHGSVIINYQYAIERGDFDHIPIPSERRWKLFGKRK